MVLVSYILYNYISILQTKFSYGEGYEARGVGLEAMPLDEHIEGRHSEGEACLERRPDSVHDLLEMKHHRQHGEHRLHEHALLPLPPSAQFEVGRVPLSDMEGGIAQDDHASIDLANQPLEGIICDIG